MRAGSRDGFASLAVGGMTLTAAYLLKRAYSSAGADALSWVLAPSCWLASTLGGLSFTHEPGAGFITHAPRMVVGPACAGVNFLIVAWLALYFRGQTELRGFARKAAWLAASAALAYLATLAVNGLRIVLAARAFESDVYAALLDKAGMHRALGVVLYVSTLLALCAAVDRLLGAARSRTAASRLAPLGWYFAVVLLVPLANRAWVAEPEAFLRHASYTLVLSLAVVGVAALLARVRDRLSSGDARA